MVNLSFRTSCLSRLLAAMLVIVGLLGWSFAAAQSQSIDSVVAIVGDDILTMSEYRNRHRQQTLEDASFPAFDGTLNRQILESMINEKIQVRQAERRGITVSEVEIDRAVAFIARQNNLTEQQLILQLESDNFTLESFRESLKNQQLIRKLTDFIANSRVSITDQELDNYLKSHPELTRGVDEKFEVGHLLVSTSGKSDQAIEAEAENLRVIREQIVDGMPFEKAVRDFADAGQDEGGYLGWRTPDQLPELFVTALRGMDVAENSISGILQSDNGLHLLRLIGRQGGNSLVQQQRIQHILIQPDQNNTPEEALEKANDLYQKIISGESFETIARLHSQDQASREGGGELGWVSPGAMVPEFEQAATALPLNTVSQPIRSRFGFHIMQVLERRTANLSGEVAKNKAREAIFRRKSASLFQTWFRRVRNQTFIEYVEG